MNIEVDLFEVSQWFNEYLKMVEQGNEIIITRSGVPIAKLVTVDKRVALLVAQKSAMKRTRSRMEKGFMSIVNKFNRDDLYTR